jgi:Fe-S cluster assembly protein SufB
VIDVERTDFVSVPVTDLERSTAWYRDRLGLEQTGHGGWPEFKLGENNVDIGHEATVSRIGEEQLFYLMSRGLTEAEASAMIVAGFVEPITKELPLEYAVEMNRLIQLQMEGSVG